MTPPTASRAVQSGRALATFLLVFAAAFGALTIISAGVGLARTGDSLLYGNALAVPVELSPDALERSSSEAGALPPGAELSR